MGLDTSHGCWHGAYSAFHRWRMELARVAGIPLPLMDSYWNYTHLTERRGGNPSLLVRAVARTATPSLFSETPDGAGVATRTSVVNALEALAAQNSDVTFMHNALEDILPFLPLSWDVLKPDPLHILLNHSDCDGHIPPGKAKRLAARLEELLPLLPAEDDLGHIGNWRAKTQTFIDGLRLAASLGENVEFH